MGYFPSVAGGGRDRDRERDRDRDSARLVQMGLMQIGEQENADGEDCGGGRGTRRARRVLSVDDDVVNQAVMLQMLQPEGFEVSAEMQEGQDFVGRVAGSRAGNWVWRALSASGDALNPTVICRYAAF